jgi:hypothetical protein
MFQQPRFFHQRLPVAQHDIEMDYNVIGEESAEMLLNFSFEADALM